MSRKNPHNLLRALDPPGENRRWQCHYCQLSGLLEEIQAVECSYVYPPCPHCGQTPECAIDCPGILAILGSSDVHVVTDDPKLAALVEQAKKREGVE